MTETYTYERTTDARCVYGRFVDSWWHGRSIDGRGTIVRVDLSDDGHSVTVRYGDYFVDPFGA